MMKKGIIFLAIIMALTGAGCTSVTINRGGQLSSSQRLEKIDSEISYLRGSETPLTPNQEKQLEQLEQAKVVILAENPAVESYEAHGRTHFLRATRGYATVLSAEGRKEVAQANAYATRSDADGRKTISEAIAEDPEKFIPAMAQVDTPVQTEKHTGVFANNFTTPVTFPVPGRAILQRVEVNGYVFVEVEKIPSEIVVFNAETGAVIRRSRWHVGEVTFEGRKCSFSFRLIPAN